MGSPRTYSQSLQGPIDASSQAATRAFMYLSEIFEEVKRLLDAVNIFNDASPDSILKCMRDVGIVLQRDIPMALKQCATYFHLQNRLNQAYIIITESLETLLELLEMSVNVLCSAFNVQTQILLELGIRAKSLSPEDPQESLRTLRELYCILNNEDTSHLRGAVISLRGLWKIHAEKERSQ